ncbi:hypothetical protein B0H66DRAFT_611144 [Apodospora peruviana]|uniref:Uncharacterized protein n=1 Tax=Apodospora peruviana TaxID=516989 RepID=A0AAE0IS03_9PEZI|nr:hypothetical protein B0H66DRAFT_611144 [Apodospora peruviana]
MSSPSVSSTPTPVSYRRRATSSWPTKTASYLVGQTTRRASGQTGSSWKQLARELLKAHYSSHVHPRFHRAELRLSRVNTIHRFTRLPPFDPNLRGWLNYGSLFRDNLAWIATATVLIALVLTAMQVRLATERLQGDADFQRVSYGFTGFSILGNSRTP